jgi:lipid-binding SYLF domain-containing protein
VNIEYDEAVSLYLGKPVEQADAAAEVTASRSEKGDKPAGAVVETVDVSSTVQGRDQADRDAQRPTGKSRLNYNRRYAMARIKTIAGFVWMAMLVAAMTVSLAGANEAEKAQKVVDDMTEVLDNLNADPDMAWFRSNLKRAHGVLLMRQYRAGFIVGVSGGRGVMLARDTKTNKWSFPAFYGQGTGSFGFQIGADTSEMALLIMTEKGRDALLTTDVKLGGDISVAAGPVGAGAKAATADVLSFARTKGIYGGVALEGMVISPQPKMNNAYYDQEVSPLDILVQHAVTNAGAAKLVETVSKAAQASK